MRGWVKSIFRRIFYGFPLIFRCFSQGMDGKGEGEKVREEWMGRDGSGEGPRVRTVLISNPRAGGKPFQDDGCSSKLGFQL